MRQKYFFWWKHWTKWNCFECEMRRFWSRIIINSKDVSEYYASSRHHFYRIILVYYRNFSFHKLHSSLTFLKSLYNFYFAHFPQNKRASAIRSQICNLQWVKPMNQFHEWMNRFVFFAENNNNNKKTYSTHQRQWNWTKS